MIKGINVFKTFFKDYKEQYVLIGGAACDIIFGETERDFRATRDLDMVLIIEALTPEFIKVFWQFISMGKYRNKSRSSGTPQFYRFDKPETPGYPYMIELFSRKPFEISSMDANLVPLYINEEVSSLSAILLNEAYYQMLLKGRREVDELMILDPIYIIPFKAKAWLDLTEKREKGIHVDERDIKKHKNDIARLAVIVEGKTKLTLSDEIKDDMQQFLENYEKEQPNLKSIGISSVKNEEILNRLKQIYLR